MKDDINELYNKDNLTQKEIIQLLLHNAQHMVTRDELKSEILQVKADLKEDIEKLDKKIDSVENRLSEKIDGVEDRLNEKIDGVEDRSNKKFDRLSAKIDRVEGKFDKLQWLIVATIITVLFKDYILRFLNSFVN